MQVSYAFYSLILIHVEQSYFGPFETFTIFILMVYPIHTNTISMDLSILHSKGRPVKFFIKRCISVP